MANQAIDINYIFSSNSKLLMETKLVKDLEFSIEQQGILLEVERKQVVYWVLRFLKFHNHQHPTDLSKTDIESFLSSLATENNYNQKLQQSAEKSIQYLYTTFLKLPISQLNYISVQQRKGYISYFGENKCRQVASHLSGKSLLILELMLLGKLRFSEVAKLKESDIDIKNNRINIFDDKSAYSDRKLLFTISIPLKLILDLRIQKMRIKQLFGCSNSKFKRSKMSEIKNDFLFHSGKFIYGSEKKIVNIKQEFKQDLKRVIEQLNRKDANLLDTKSERRFKQLRMSLYERDTNSLVSNRVMFLDNMEQKRIRNKDLQFELEVA